MRLAAPKIVDFTYKGKDLFYYVPSSFFQVGGKVRQHFSFIRASDIKAPGKAGQRGAFGQQLIQGAVLIGREIINCSHIVGGFWRNGDMQDFFCPCLLATIGGVVNGFNFC
ncbi:hypothetical protein AALC17_17050 [Oscillospiraceae bacterium 38-13]